MASFIFAAMQFFEKKADGNTKDYKRKTKVDAESKRLSKASVVY